MKCTTRILATFAALAMVGHASVASAGYIIDSTESFIQIGVQINEPLTLALTPQGGANSGNNIATFTGTINASVVGGDLVISGANIVADTKPGPFDPGGIDGNVALTGSAFFGLAQVRAVIRDLVFGLSGTTMLSGDNFDLSPLGIAIDQGSLNYSYSVPLVGSDTGSEDIDGLTAVLPAGTGTLIGNTLTIPVNTTIPFDLEGDIDFVGSVTLSGQLVAVVPEPASLGLVGLAMTINLVRRRRQI